MEKKHYCFLPFSDENTRATLFGVCSEDIGWLTEINLAQK
jgi:hypothetical protein